MTKALSYDEDFYSDEFIAAPYPHYQAMRDLAPVVYLPRNDCYALTRFADIRDALRNDTIFLSGRGVMMNDPTNQFAAGTSGLNMDEPQHGTARKMMGQPLMPAALKPLRAEIQQIADTLVDTLVSRKTFDGIADFAHVLPLELVSRLVGFPADGRAQMLEWAFGIFNTMGNINARFTEGATATEGLLAYIATIEPRQMLPGSWGARLFEKVAAGELEAQAARGMIFDYSVPALDTTINATGSTLWLLGQHPEQWDALRADPALIPAAAEEAMRLETPIRAFSRVVAEEIDVDGVTLPTDARVLMVYASANRDERHWGANAADYDIRRKAPQEQLAFGTGIHMCVGQHLARLEMRCLFEALAKRVARFEVGAIQRELHQLLRGLKSVEVTITQAA